VVKIKSLSDLKQVQQAIEKQALQEAAAKLERERAALQAASEKNLFIKAIGQVQALPDPGRAALQKTTVKVQALQHQRDEQAALQESMSDEFDVSTLLDTDEHLSYSKPGIGIDVKRKLRQGHWSIQGQLDLHGLRSDEAREALGHFIREACKNGLRCVRVIHGKGLGSPGKTPVLKNRVHSWLVQKNEVLAFVQARPADGGAGAVVALLQASH
jgi:DNA-nicking Smr family endonuclease